MRLVLLVSFLVVALAGCTNLYTNNRFTPRPLAQNFETSYREYQARFLKYEDEAPTLSPAEDAKRKSELELMERNLAQSQQNIEKQIAEKKELLYGPIRLKARELVTKIAEDLGFLYVLDSSKDNGLVMAKGKDLMPEVKRSLGVR